MRANIESECLCLKDSCDKNISLFHQGIRRSRHGSLPAKVLYGGQVTSAPVTQATDFRRRGLDYIRLMVGSRP